MMIMVAVVIIVIGVGVVVVFIVIRRKKPKAAEISGATTQESEAEKLGEIQKSVPLDTLEERYARGEITKDEYERLKSVLEKD
ncbi:MAG: SHOCT domain-containing protein [Theionarchaea archaeon]|nr:SHOCT domain-containing protein [Theionarchaea archaeon]